MRDRRWLLGLGLVLGGILFATNPGSAGVLDTSWTAPTNNTDGSALGQVFPVQNTGAGTVTGTASVSAPFSIFSGSPFTLSAGATKSVIVRFTPTNTALSSTSVSFTADGDTLQRLVTGTGVSTTT